MIASLNRLGVDAYSGATRLVVIESDQTKRKSTNNYTPHPDHEQDSTHTSHYPDEARMLFDHLIYLPVNKTVPYEDLDRICQMVDISVQSCQKNSSLTEQILIQSKL